MVRHTLQVHKIIRYFSVHIPHTFILLYSYYDALLNFAIVMEMLSMLILQKYFF